SIPAAVVMSKADSLPTAITAALVLGFALGMYLPLGMGLIVDMGRGGRGPAYMSVHELAATLASFIGSAAVALLLAWTDWHGSILAWCVVGVLATVAFVAVRDPEGDRRHVEKVREHVPVDFRLFCAVFSYGIGTMLVMGLVSMLALIMVRAQGLDQVHAASVLGYTRLAGLLGVVAVALLADRLGHVRVLMGLQMVALAGLVLMSLDGFGLVFVAGVVLLAVGASGNITLNPVVIAEAFPSGQRERVMAYATGPGALLGTVVAPALFGVMLDAGLSTGPVLFAAGATLVAIFLTGRIAR
ncbi:MAG TPA: MFS transporter, partial [Chloroflexota bacterium]|nr:MFS transporter [Chloroflexota bacterium]